MKIECNTETLVGKLSSSEAHANDVAPLWVNYAFMIVKPYYSNLMRKNLIEYNTVRV